MENMEFLKAMLAEMNSKMDASQEKMETNTNKMQAKMEDTMESQIGFLVSRMEVARKINREEMKAVVQSIWSERYETIEQQVKNIMMCINHKTQSLQKACQETAACHKDMETDTEQIQPGPRMMQCIAEHQEVPTEEAAMMPLRGLRRQHGDQNLAPGHSQKPKVRIQASCESRKI
jgi:hypothetical protein